MKTLMDYVQRKRQLERLQNLKPGTQPKWGALSASNLLPHLTDPFKIALGEMEAVPVKSFFTTGVGKFIAIFLMPRWPKGAPTHPKTNIAIAGRKGKDFEQDRKELVDTIARFIDSYSKLPTTNTPYLARSPTAPGA